MSRAWPVLWYRFKGTWRGRLLGYLGVALVIALTGGVAMAALAGARRTQSAYPTYLASTNPSDLAALAPPSDTPGRTDTLTRKLRSLPQVTRVTTGLLNANLDLLGRDGMPQFVPFNGVFLGSTDGMFTDMDRLTAIQGRLADPSRPDEVTITADTERLLHWKVGTVIPIGFFTMKQQYDPRFGHVHFTPLSRVDLHVVGIVDTSGTVLEDDIDHSVGAVIVTPALVREHDYLVWGTVYHLQLRHGAADIPAVEKEFVDAIPQGRSYDLRVTADTTDRVQRAITPEATALAIFGAIAALIALVVSALAVSRHVRAGGEARAVLRAMGAGTFLTAADGLPGATLSVGAGAVGAVLVAIALSPLSPIGPVRAVYPRRGVAADWTVLVLGATALVVVLLGVAGVAAYRSAPHRLARTQRSSRVSTAGRLARSAGLPTPLVLGTTYAIEPARGRDAVPVRSVLVGTVVAVATVIATLTFASGLHTLVSRPRLYGWNWDVALQSPGEVPLATEQLLARDPDVSAILGIKEASAQIDGQSVPILMSRTPAAMSMTMISGRGVASRNEVVLAPNTLARLHKHVGQSVTVTYGSPSDAPVYIPPTPLRIVGTATLPAIGQTGLISDHTTMGTGAWVSVSIIPPAMAQAITPTEPQEGGWDLMFVRFRDGVSEQAGRASMQTAMQQIDDEFASDANTQGQALAVLPVERPAEIVDYRAIGATPVVFACLLAAGAALALALSLVASVRQRRRDLAVLKALGLRRRQLAATVEWQAAVVAVVGLVVGVPLGVIAGRQLWILFAHAIDVVPDPTVPVPAIALVAVATVVFAIVVAVVPGRSAARTPTALALRTE
jgi:hypothetical protein